MTYCKPHFKALNTAVVSVPPSLASHRLDCPQMKLQLAASGAPSVLLSSEARRQGGYTLRLHSGISVRNDTALSVRIGWRHSPDGDVSLVDTLGPGGMLAVPVINAREGDLCLQPAGTQESSLLTCEQFCSTQSSL